MDSPRDPTPLLAQAVAGVKPGRALDLACGTGRNAAWLARQGWSVTAVDASAAAIETLQKRCDAVDAQVADLEKHEFTIEPSAWDLIAVCYYLQPDLFEPLKGGVKPGGIALAIVHLFDPAREHSRFCVQAGELAKYFDTWEILHYREGRATDPAHRRLVAEIIARKP